MPAQDKLHLEPNIQNRYIKKDIINHSLSIAWRIVRTAQVFSCVIFDLFIFDKPEKEDKKSLFQNVAKQELPLYSMRFSLSIMLMVHQHCIIVSSHTHPTHFF